MPCCAYKEVVVLVGGMPVCVGDMRFAAEALGVAYESLRTYLYASPLAGTRVVRLESLWLVAGCEVPVPTAAASKLAGCAVEEVRLIANRPYDKRITRYRRRRWSLPPEVIDELRQDDRRRRSAARRKKPDAGAAR